MLMEHPPRSGGLTDAIGIEQVKPGASTPRRGGASPTASDAATQRSTTDTPATCIRSVLSQGSYTLSSGTPSAPLTRSGSHRRPETHPPIPSSVGVRRPPPAKPTVCSSASRYAAVSSR